ncbi:MAG TPA: type II toxin-antitoxin system RelE/ParE family toxin [Coxiellaceae bacterium]|nr:MAG: hypothetical protein A3E81_05370 [Gammaproteobacteria bacterium RIFCSPHIGHO2_12_FULL_36_30]HLB57025.1 type II toxin-antitoxin system RelE/ParE family toxin [Coxiellaceae bacterium]
MKPLYFLGDSHKKLCAFNKEVRQDVGFQLDKVQRGEQPDDFKSMTSIGKGVEEIRVWDESGTYRVIYTARIKNAIYVLHAFQKKTHETAQSDIDMAKKRFSELMRNI